MEGTGLYDGHFSCPGGWGGSYTEGKKIHQNIPSCQALVQWNHYLVIGHSPGIRGDVPRVSPQSHPLLLLSILTPSLLEMHAELGKGMQVYGEHAVYAFLLQRWEPNHTGLGTLGQSLVLAQGLLAPSRTIFHSVLTHTRWQWGWLENIENEDVQKKRRRCEPKPSGFHIQRVCGMGSSFLPCSQCSYLITVGL